MDGQRFDAVEGAVAGGSTRRRAPRLAGATGGRAMRRHVIGAVLVGGLLALPGGPGGAGAQQAPNPIACDGGECTGTEFADAITGSGGEDRILAPRGFDDVDAGPGADEVRGQGGGDSIQGGAGVDLLIGGPGADLIRDEGATEDTLSGGPGTDLMIGGDGDDEVRGDDGPDALNLDGFFFLGLDGGPGNDRVFGGRGSGAVSGGPGEDEIFGGIGTDLLYSRDGEPDVVDCGPGVDEALVDPSTDKASNCEKVTEVAPRTARAGANDAGLRARAIAAFREKYHEGR